MMLLRLYSFSHPYSTPWTPLTCVHILTKCIYSWYEALCSMYTMALTSSNCWGCNPGFLFKSLCNDIAKPLGSDTSPHAQTRQVLSTVEEHTNNPLLCVLNDSKTRTTLPTLLDLTAFLRWSLECSLSCICINFDLVLIFRRKNSSFILISHTDRVAVWVLPRGHHSLYSIVNLASFLYF